MLVEFFRSLSFLGNMEVSEENSPETATPSPTVYDGDDDPVVHEVRIPGQFSTH